MQLRKWASNAPELFESIPEELREVKLPLTITDDYGLPTFGLKWNPSTEMFTLFIPSVSPLATPTIREVLSLGARLYDPMGWLSPVTIRPKLLLQKLWKSIIIGTHRSHPL